MFNSSDAFIESMKNTTPDSDVNHTDDRIDETMKTFTSTYTSSPIYNNPVKVSKHRCVRKPKKKIKVKHGNRKKK